MTAPLHVYHVRRPGAGPGGCREYVAVAESEDRALWYCPAGGHDVPAWAVAVVHLGIAVNGVAAGVVMPASTRGDPAIHR